MKDRKFSLVLWVFMATSSACCSVSFASERIPLCDQLHPRSAEDFNPFKASLEAAAASQIGGHGGRTLSATASSLVSKGFLIQEAGVISGRLLVWIFEVSNPFAVAIGFILDPRTTAKCDTPLTNSSECKQQLACIQVLSALPDPAAQ